ncbi:hypothetical protein AS890_12930 [Rhizobium anhuiense bv. trifolii]|nr:hypothetical protein AS890_12930 [Rhizobium anhuiense bv. trifolii]
MRWPASNPQPPSAAGEIDRRARLEGAAGKAANLRAGMVLLRGVALLGASKRVDLGFDRRHRRAEDGSDFDIVPAGAEEPSAFMWVPCCAAAALSWKLIA